MVGSNVFNIAALLGLSAVIAGHVRIHRHGLVLSGGVATVAALFGMLVVLRWLPAWGGFVLVLLALGLGEVSVVIPLAGTAPLFVLFLAYLFPSGAAKLGWRVVAGAVLIVLGVFLLTGR